MGQIIFSDKIGQLTHSAGTIYMAASVASPAYLTIGGQQYTVTSQLSVALPTMTANTRYQVFAVQSAGVVSLVISSNENSVGPAGYTGWKLVGSLYSNASLAFGSFVNIKGVPRSEIPFTIAASLSNTTNSANLAVKGERVGGNMVGNAYWEYTGAGGSNTPDMTLTNLSVDTARLAANQTKNRDFLGRGIMHVSAADAASFDVINNAGLISILSDGSGNAASNRLIARDTWFGGLPPASGYWITLNFNVPISGWTATPIEDL